MDHKYLTRYFQGWVTYSVHCDSSVNLLNPEILTPFADPPIMMLEKILTDHIKSLFKFNPHPSLNLSTGRKLPENAGGPMGMQDYYEGQVWKKHLGAPNLISWCVRNIQVHQ